MTPNFLRPHLLAGIVLGFLMGVVGGSVPARTQLPDRPDAPAAPEQTDLLGQAKPDVPYVPTPIPVVDRMLEVADIGEKDRVYDLGSGDGRILIRAARKYGARGVGYELNGMLVREARKYARAAGVEDLVEFRQRDLFEADLSEATVVTLYLSDSTKVQLRPKLLTEVDPGTPVISHEFRMGGWKPSYTELHEGHHILRWLIPEKIPTFESSTRSRIHN